MFANEAIRASHVRVPELNPFFANHVSETFGAPEIGNRRFEAIRENHSNVMKIGAFLQIDSRKSPRFALRIAELSKFLSVNFLVFGLEQDLDQRGIHEKATQQFQGNFTQKLA